MPFDPKSPKKAGEKFKRGPAKKEERSIKEKMEMRYEKVLDDLTHKPRQAYKNRKGKSFCNPV
jgi:hypothetical protein